MHLNQALPFTLFLASLNLITTTSALPAPPDTSNSLIDAICPPSERGPNSTIPIDLTSPPDPELTQLLTTYLSQLSDPQNNIPIPGTTLSLTVTPCLTKTLNEDDASDTLLDLADRLNKIPGNFVQRIPWLNAAANLAAYIEPDPERPNPMAPVPVKIAAKAVNELANELGYAPEVPSVTLTFKVVIDDGRSIMEGALYMPEKVVGLGNSVQ